MSSPLSEAELIHELVFVHAADQNGDVKNSTKRRYLHTGREREIERMESVTADLVMQLLKQGLQPLSTMPHGQIIGRGHGRDADQNKKNIRGKSNL